MNTPSRPPIPRANIALALVLISIGAWFLSIQLYPPLKDFAYGENNWPVPIIGIGVLMALVGIATWTPGWLVPACVVGGIGALLYYQNANNAWDTWSFAWALIPGFGGLGGMLAGLMSLDWGDVVDGLKTILVSLALFALFGWWLGDLGKLGQLEDVVKYWPVLLIALGVVLTLQAFIRRPSERK